jgi:thioesterase domain-containing protein
VYPLGVGMPGAQLLVLNARGQLAGIGELGELYMRSPHLARGYLDDPDLTAARFVANPHTADPADRLYRTGDLGRYRADGGVEFAGRADRQLKLRGFRVEPGEIEAVLRQYPQVRDAVVRLHERPGREPLLAAVLAAEPAPDMADLRAFLRQRLPDFMVPAAVTAVPRLPLTPNGKVDLAALPPPDLAAQSPAAGAGGEPRGEVERRLAAVWQEVLGLPQVGVHDNFFELGGHSLLSMRLFARIEAVFGRRLPVSLLFEAPTIAEMAPALRGERQTSLQDHLVTIQPRGQRPPLFLVHGIGGGVMGYAELARQLGDERPIYGLLARGFQDGNAPDKTIEAIAAYYLPIIRAAQPQGPYHLGGYCFGGVVAYELARQLREQGEQVGVVAVIEGYAPIKVLKGERLWHPRRVLATLRNLPNWLQDYFSLGGREMWRRAVHTWAVLGRQMALRLGLRRESLRPREIMRDADQLPDHVQRLLRVQFRAMASFDPQPYPGDLALFNIRSQSMLRNPDPRRGWDRIVRGQVQVNRIAGSHHNVLQLPHVPTLARALSACLAEADGAKQNGAAENAPAGPHTAPRAGSNGAGRAAGGER